MVSPKEQAAVNTTTSSQKIISHGTYFLFVSSSSNADDEYRNKDCSFGNILHAKLMRRIYKRGLWEIDRKITSSIFLDVCLISGLRSASSYHVHT